MMPLNGFSGDEHYQMIMNPQLRYTTEGMREIQTPRSEAKLLTKRGRSKQVDALPQIPASTTNNYSGRFILLEQPNVRQRKSYKNENRYVLPNPLSICAREEVPGEKAPRILEGMASVMLVGAEGQELPPSKASILESPEGGLVQPFDSNLSAHFSLKILDTSEGSMYRLLFTITFTLEGVGACEEKILSRPFQVYSNRKKQVKGQERPVVYDLKPTEGIASGETEVWIKGRGFSDKVVVSFGDKLGRIIETTENLLTVAAPPRFDVSQDMPVQVVVSNKYLHEQLAADRKLTFYYLNQNIPLIQYTQMT
jgi:hypothetical protein